MDWTLIYGFLIAMGLFVVVWFALVVPSERRDHERKLALVRKRLAERERLRQQTSEQDSATGPGDDRE